MRENAEVNAVSLSISDPEVFSVDAASGPSDDHHATWTVGYAPEIEVELKARVIIATLHVGGTAGYGTIHVGALLLGEGGTDLKDAELEALLAGSDAIETLYDFARVSLRSALAIVDSDAVVARKSPTPAFEVLEKADAVGTSESDDEA